MRAVVVEAMFTQRDLVDSIYEYWVLCIHGHVERLSHTLGLWQSDESPNLMMHGCLECGLGIVAQ